MLAVLQQSADSDVESGTSTPRSAPGSPIKGLPPGSPIHPSDTPRQVRQLTLAWRLRCARRSPLHSCIAARFCKCPPADERSQRADHMFHVPVPICRLGLALSRDTWCSSYYS